MKKPRSVEARYPTKRAREIADAAIDAMPESAPMTAYIDAWLSAYFANGGMEKR